MWGEKLCEYYVCVCDIPQATNCIPTPYPPHQTPTPYSFNRIKVRQMRASIYTYMGLCVGRVMRWAYAIWVCAGFKECVGGGGECAGFGLKMGCVYMLDSFYSANKHRIVICKRRKGEAMKHNEIKLSRIHVKKGRCCRKNGRTRVGRISQCTWRSRCRSSCV